MNLLVTNTQSGQTYSIIRCLRSEANKIVATMYGKYRIQARTAHAANSRYVNKRYYVPDPAGDWYAGRIQRENTDKEEVYVRRIEEICRLEDIDTIFPSFDPEVYVLSKNKPRFQEQGILIVAPEYELLRIPMDKYLSVVEAQKAGFPCPETYLPASVEELKEVVGKIGPPWVIKPRFTAGSKGTAIVTAPSELEGIFQQVSEQHHRPMVQEFIPGKGRRNYYVTVDRNSEINSLLTPEVVRIAKRLFRNSSVASISSSTGPYMGQIAVLLRQLKWWGGLTIQTKVDARDGIPKLMEINPRLGSHLWYRTELGVNEPLICLKLARGEDLQKTNAFPEGVFLLEPLEDLLGFGFELIDLILFRFRNVILGAKPTDPLNTPESLNQMFRGYATTYFNKTRKVFIPESRYILSDPLPCLFWYYAFIGYSLRSLKHLGR